MARWVTDQLQREVEVPDRPKRIISLVPSQTELLYDLGLGDRVVGITKFCVHPESWFRSKTRIGGTKQLHQDTIASLRPDLIIANKEENTKEDVALLANKYPVWVSDVRTLTDAMAMIRAVGDLVGAAEQGVGLANQVEQSIGTWPSLNNKHVAYLIWRNPWMGVGSDTFIDAVLSQLGVSNVLARRERYPEIKLDELAAAVTEEVWLSSEPYPFAEKHRAEINAALPGVQVRLVDGELFSWYGSRMLRMAPYFKSDFSGCME